MLKDNAGKREKERRDQFTTLIKKILKIIINRLVFEIKT